MADSYAPGAGQTGYRMRVLHLRLRFLFLLSHLALEHRGGDGRRDRREDCLRILLGNE